MNFLKKIGGAFSGRNGYERLSENDVLEAKHVYTIPSDPEKLPLLSGRVIQPSDQEPAIPRFAQSPSTRGVDLINRECYDEAEIVFRVLVDQYPDNPYINNNLACALLFLNRYQEAEPFIRKAINAIPNDFAFRNNWASYLAKTGNLNEALAIWQNLLKVSPDSYAVNKNLGKCLFDSDCPNEAKFYLLKACAKAPTEKEKAWLEAKILKCSD